MRQQGNRHSLFHQEQEYEVVWARWREIWECVSKGVKICMLEPEWDEEGFCAALMTAAGHEWVEDMSMWES